MKRLTLATLALAAVLIVGPVSGSANAQEPAGLDTRWLPWLGCWQLWEEQRGTPLTPGPGFSGDGEDETASLVGRTLVCVTPSETGPGVELTAAAGDQVLVERTLIADGERRDVPEPGCEGWERSEWARDGHRLFTHAELTCGDQPTRSVHGVSFLASRSTWTDIQIVEVGSRQHVEVRRYHPVSAERRDELVGASFRLPVDPADVRVARAAVTEELTVADVMEATAATAPRVVEALLVETEPRLDLDSDALIALDDAGVDTTVIDLMVALAYPERFRVERRDRGGGWSSGGGFGGFYDPIWYGNLYPYYITPFGATYWTSGYNPYLFGGATSPFVTVLAESDFDDPTGRAVMGRGYTRVVRVQPSESDGTVTGRRAKRRGSSGGDAATSSRSGGSSRGGGGSRVASPRGYSRGGSTSGRTAAPRQPPSKP